jgi:dTDP-4-amino-4,6-dideoxygalactose transaminase
VALVAARIGLGQLPFLEKITSRRRALAKLYFEQWDASLGCELPPRDFESSNGHMLQVVLPADAERA